MTTTPTYDVGTLVVFDSSSGMLKGKLVELHRDSGGLWLTVKITAKHRRRGEVIETTPHHVIPRAHFHKSRRGPFHYYTTPYRWAL